MISCLNVSPYFQNDLVTLYQGDAMALFSSLPMVDAVITDPPYGETSLEWDSWPYGWPRCVALLTDQLWCFGSMRMFMDRINEFNVWKLAQDIVWEKHNGSGSAKDRFRRVHENALHFYHGSWKEKYKETQFTNDATARKVHRKNKPPHWGDIGASDYSSVDGGPRLTRSVIKARSCHGYAVNETQKPEDIVLPLLQFSVPIGGTVLDCFAGSGTTGLVALKTGRKAILIEKRESQCRHIVNRIQALEKRL